MAASRKFTELGAALRKARELAALTQEEAAAQLGMHATQLSRYESGQRQAPVDVVRRAEQLYEQIILEPTQPTGVSRETPFGQAVAGAPHGDRNRHRQVLLTTASKLSALAADLIREANEGVPR